MSYASRVRGSSKPADRSQTARFIMGLVGYNVAVELCSGDVYEGVLLKSTTPTTYVIGIAKLVASRKQSDVASSPFEDERSFQSYDVSCVRIKHEKKVEREKKEDRSEAVSNPTDSDSRQPHRNAPPPRPLEKWDGGSTVEDSSVSLDQEAKTRSKDLGWDQFEVNKKLFGYQSSYVEEEYTTELDRNSDFYRQHQAMASKVAREIQNETSSNSHIAEERGHSVATELDEESRFSTVLGDDAASKTKPSRATRARTASKGSSSSTPARDQSAGSDKPSNLYVPPALRNQSSEKAPTISKSKSPSPEFNSRSPVTRSRSPHVRAQFSEKKSPDQRSQSSKMDDDHESKEACSVASSEKSTLNVNAKEFQFNAAAQEFVPSNPNVVYATGNDYVPIAQLMGAYPGMLPPYSIVAPVGYFPDNAFAAPFTAQSVVFPVGPSENFPMSYPEFGHGGQYIRSSYHRPKRRDFQKHKNNFSEAKPTD